MVQLASILHLLRLPSEVLWVLIKYVTGTTNFRKYEKRLKICIKLTLYRWALGFHIPDASIISGASNSALFSAMKLLHSKDVKALPSFGERLGQHGIWLAKKPQRSVHDPVIIYIHGGGYFLQTQLEQLKSLVAIYKNLDPSKNYSLLLLDYDLVSFGHKLPRQLRQLDSVYSGLVEDGNDNIVLMGDSAGGHLSISFTQYIHSHKPYLPYPTQLVMISPWCKLIFDAKDELRAGRSYHDNRKRDLISIDLFKPESSELFLNEEKLEYHPYYKWSVGKVHETNWKDIPFFKNPKSKLYVIFGEDESFRDHIIEWVNEVYGANTVNHVRTNNKLIPECTTVVKKPDQAQLTCYMEPWGVHDATFFIEYDCIKKLDKSKHFGVTRVIDFLNS